jgi:hypothetical protein
MIIWGDWYVYSSTYYNFILKEEAIPGASTAEHITDGCRLSE